MSKIVQAAKAAQASITRLLKPGHSVAAALAVRRGDALGTWRALVEAHVNGKSIDLDQLETCGLSLRLRDVAQAFENDCKAFREEREFQDTHARAMADADKLQPAADRAKEECEYYANNISRLRTEAQAADWARVGAGYSASHAMALRRKHPRLWNDARTDEGVEVAEARMAVDQVQPEPEEVPAQRAPAGGAQLMEAQWE